MKRILLLCLVAAAILALFGCRGKSQNTASSAGTAAYTAGFLMETYDLDRWKRDEEFFREKANSLGVTVLRAVADGDQDRQNKQAETFLTQGVDVLVVVPKNLNTAARIVKSAHEKNVPVLAYDRLMLDCDLDIYITFDNEKVGYLQAYGILQKVPEGNFILLGGAASDNNARLLRTGQLRAIKEHELQTKKKITILADPFLDDWDREEARRRIGNLITKFSAEGKRSTRSLRRTMQPQAVSLPPCRRKRWREQSPSPGRMLNYRHASASLREHKQSPCTSRFGCSPRFRLKSCSALRKKKNRRRLSRRSDLPSTILITDSKKCLQSSLSRCLLRKKTW